MLETINQPIFRKIFLGLAIVISCYMLYRGYKKILAWQEARPIFITSPHEGRTPLTIEKEKIPAPEDGYSYNLMFWLHIDDFEYRRNEWKHIVHKGEEDEGEDCQPGVWLTPGKNNMLIRYDLKGKKGNFKYHKGKAFGSYSNPYRRKYYYKQFRNKTIGELKEISINHGSHGFVTKAKKGARMHDGYLTDLAFVKTRDLPEDNVRRTRGDRMHDMVVFSFQSQFVSLSPEVPNTIKDPNHRFSSLIENIPLNRWIHVNIMVNPNGADVYIDGKLRQSTPFGSLVNQNTGNLYVAQRGGFGGRITQLTMYNNVSPPSSALTMYNLGPDPPRLPNIKPPKLAKFVPKVKFNVQVEAEGLDKLIPKDKYMLCDDAAFKKEYAAMEKSEGPSSAKEFKFKRTMKLKQKKKELAKKKKTFAQFCKEQKENKGKIGFGADSENLL